MHLEEDEHDLERSAHASAAPLVHSAIHASLKRHGQEHERADDPDAHAEGRGRSAEAGHAVERHRPEVLLLLRSKRVGRGVVCVSGACHNVT